jgi:uncharacterized protein YjbI with pentapeptide repeats
MPDTTDPPSTPAQLPAGLERGSNRATPAVVNDQTSVISQDVPPGIMETLAAQGFPGPVPKPVAWWSKPFVRVESWMEWVVSRLNRWAFLDLLQRLALFSIAVGAIKVVWAWSKQSETVERAAVEATKAKHYAAWQLINSAQGKGGSGGRVDALQDLVNDSVSLEGVKLDSAWLDSIQLAGARLSRASLRGARLVKANLRGARLIDANLEGVILYGANLQGAHLDGANLQGAYLDGADLRRAQLAKADLRRAQLSRVDLRDAQLSLASLQDAKLPEANLRHAILMFTDLAKADLSRADLREAEFAGASLARAVLFRADLRGALLGGAPYYGDTTTVYLQGWREINWFEANVSGVRNAPPGFRRWAIDTMGAVEIPPAP